MSEIDLLEDVAPASKQDLGALGALAQKLVDLEREIESDEEKLKQKKQDLKMLAEQDIPDMMQEIGVQRLELTDGSLIEIKNVIQASIPSQSAIDRAKEESKRAELVVLQQQCFGWLRENGGADLIKNTVEVQFGRDEDKNCQQFTNSLREQGLNHKRATTVHPGTLNSFMRERIEGGKEVPMELFRVFTGRRANIRRG